MSTAAVARRHSHQSEGSPTGANSGDHTYHLPGETLGCDRPAADLTRERRVPFSGRRGRLGPSTSPPESRQIVTGGGTDTEVAAAVTEFSETPGPWSRPYLSGRIPPDSGQETGPYEPHSRCDTAESVNFSEQPFCSVDPALKLY
ncbi:hypothetical protein RHA1_ro10390 (plasmid) [Rhodococcus jostii RHA1]|uniref:Uncharacterized protein n=1 Tax=Rhodococcus jostii (strain RHA1) TaxID=101510 RepID=Q0RVV7_RHOJR|nr:hypothetical protein RHA1_ro10390 [Rhodococcus jostii RHA1]